MSPLSPDFEDPELCEPGSAAVPGRHLQPSPDFEDPGLCEAVLADHWRHSPHRGRCDAENAFAQGENQICGDIVRLSMDSGGSRIRCLRCDGAGCAVSQAAASLVAAEVTGRTFEEARTFAAAAYAFLHGGAPTGTSFDALRVVRSNPARVVCALVAVRLLGELLESRGQ